MFISRLQSLRSTIRQFFATWWARYRGLSKRSQIGIGVVVAVALIWVGHALTSGGSVVADSATLPTVTLARVDALSGTGSSVAVIGSVRSVNEADVIAQSSGTVTTLSSSLGSSVGAGTVIASLENSSQRAAVLQAQGSYDAARAAQSAASPTDIAASARNTYVTAYTTLDTLLKTDIDTFYGGQGGQGPQFLINPSPFDFIYFGQKRQALDNALAAWNTHLASANETNPDTLLAEADTVTHQAVALANDIAQVATTKNTDASAAQLTALAAARSGLTALQSSITAAKAAYQGQNTSATAGADAAVKIALGTLHAAEAQLEKTLIRAPIGGTINFLPIHVGDYVTAFSHVATVAQNGTLEIVTNVSEENAAVLSRGTPVTVGDTFRGVVTTIAPALDPVTKQIEVHLVLTGTSTLVNGQSVRIALPSAAPIATSTGPLLLPLTSLKLTPSARVVFSVGADSRLVAHQVEIGDVHGDRILITTPLPADLMIVTDARGFSEGEKVSVAP